MVALGSYYPHFGCLPWSLVWPHLCLSVPQVVSSRTHLFPFLPSERQTSLGNCITIQVKPALDNPWKSSSDVFSCINWALCLPFSLLSSLLSMLSSKNTHGTLHFLSKFMQCFLISFRIKSRFFILKPKIATYQEPQAQWNSDKHFSTILILHSEKPLKGIF